MKVLMLGWEFPPFISGGLGTACYGLTKGLSELGTQVSFLLPRPIESQFAGHVNLLGCGGPAGCAPGENVMLRFLDVQLYPYSTPGEKAVPVGVTGQVSQFGQWTKGCSAGLPAAHYGTDIYEQTDKYSRLACQVGACETFDLVHAHDWMTLPAGVAVAKASGRPLVAHIHSTEFDRSGEHVNQHIYDVERYGMYHADRVITVSDFTKRICMDRYCVPEAKLSVVHNGVTQPVGGHTCSLSPTDKDEKVVLFLGRITMQKGPEYFIAAAKKVLEKMDDVKFIMAGSGDMYTRMIELAAYMGIGHKVFFTGFLQGSQVDRAFEMADLYVMPSVSEPFGISPLESLAHNVPVIISKQSGVAEVLNHALKVDFWDIDEMANKIISVLRHPPLQTTLAQNGSADAAQCHWTESARKCHNVYNMAMKRAG